ncbi:hypothetical protein [Candidatus Accumulibacter sp. ACC007]|uniref:hypothetical protein n=1 Tax=Candidatus Accumulibacter sp. ACC007 TaxID=2823333 RepID=UPI0025B8F178|nr:hypothetical protein [Candidatus Accumulibacter sp. ACC007]
MPALLIGNDNDFLATRPGGLAKANHWFVFAFGDTGLGGSTFVQQSIRARRERPAGR